ncbi:MAG: ABC transporter substrate-binding protein [Burkholderiales bacterium]
MIARRQVLIAFILGALSAALPSLAQQPERRVRRIGFLSGQSAQTNVSRLASLREAMAELGWAEGRDYVMDARFGEGVFQAYAVLAAELVATQPDLLLTPGDEGVRVLVQRTKTIPIVVMFAQDPVGSRYAASLQRPGGNVTGMASLSRDLGGKRLQLLKEAVPRVTHVGVLFEPADAGGLPQVQDIEQAAARLGVRVTPIEVRKPADIEPAFQRGVAFGADAFALTQSFLFTSEQQAIVDRCLRAKAPAVFLVRSAVDSGGLLSYYPVPLDTFRRTASYVDRILKGARPGDLPMEQPTRFELGLNLKTARAMGITFPQSILLRADRVIE